MSQPSQSFQIVRSEVGKTIAAVLKRRLSLSWSDARRLLAERRVRLTDRVCTDDARRVRAGQRVAAHPGKPRRERARHDVTVRPVVGKPEGPHSAAPIIVYADDQIVVVNKPPGMTTMRYADEAGEF